MARTSTSRIRLGPSWLWSYGSWIYNYLCNHWLSPLTLWVQILPWRGVIDTTLCDKVCQWLATGQWFFSGSSGFLRHNLTEILLKVVLNTNQSISHRMRSLWNTSNTRFWYQLRHGTMVLVLIRVTAVVMLK
jgi:hypothetical protein